MSLRFGGGGDVRLRLGQAFRQHLVFCSCSNFRTDTLASVLTQLHSELLHLIVVQVFLDQVAFPLYTSLHIRRHIRNQPRHKELHHKHNMLKKTKINGKTEASKMHDDKTTKVLKLLYLHNNNKSHFGCQDMPELHVVRVFILMAWRVAVISVPIHNMFYINNI